MFYRWLHKSWKYFWSIIFALLLTVVILLGALIGMLQMDVTQDYLAKRIEQQVEQSYKADLTIKDIDGFLPFNLNMNDVVLVRKDSAGTDTLATIKRISSQIDIWGLLQNKVSITGFSVDQPRVLLQSGEQGRLILLEKKTTARQDQDSETEEPWLSNVEILAPDVRIRDGAVSLKATTNKNQIGNLPQSFSLTNIDASLFVDWTERQRYLDIESFSANTTNLKMGKLAFSGQMYSDERFLEFNSFYVTIGNSQFVINGEIDGTNLLEPDFTGQLSSSHYNLSINSEEIFLKDLRDFFGNTPNIDRPLTLEVTAEGTTDSLWVDKATLGMGESSVNMNGLFKNIQDTKNIAYEIRLDQVTLQKDDVVGFVDSAAVPNYRVFENLRVSGKASGNMDTLDVDLAFFSPLGELKLDGRSQLNAPYQYRGTMSASRLDASPFFTSRIDTTSLNFDARLEGAGLTLEDAVASFNATFVNSLVNDVKFESLNLKSSLADKFWSQEYEYQNGQEKITGSGWVDFSQEEPPVSMQGNAQNIDLAKLFGPWGVSSSKLNFSYNVELQGLKPDRVQGRANLDIKQSIIGSDTVRAHQLYMDLNSPDEPTRSFRLTSSLFDMRMSGQLVPSDIVDQTKFWSAYLRNKFKSEILMEIPADSQATDIRPPNQSVVFEGNIEAKDLELIKKYLPNFPTITTDSQINFNVNTNGTRLLVSAEMQADTLVYDNLRFSDSGTQFTASFRSDRDFSEFSSVDMEANVGALETDAVDLDSMGVDLAVKRDSVYFTQHVGSISDNARFQMTVNSSISDSTIAVSIRDFFLGNQDYAWTNQGSPSFTYQRNGNVDFNDFSFQNRNEYFQLQGTLSKNRSDSLIYNLRDIDLSRISDLIKGRIDFEGVLNGTLITRSLTRQPTIQGNLDVTRLTLNDRMVGDVRFDSRYNPGEDRFDTQIDIITDTTKYKSYLENNDNVGQNIRLDGYFVTPNPDVRQDSVFYFDADFRQIDLWILPLIVDNVFTEVEGQATGEGYITGNFEDFDDFDFHADFQTENVYARPNFINTNYFLSGPVEFGMDEGVVLDSLNVMDTKGGRGVLWGNIDLNNFDPLTFFDLTMDMNRLQFINNTYDPDVPFYGNASGSGVVHLTGSNTDFYMRTPNPIRVTNSSEMSIPLLEETQLNETGKFIRFVDSFENIDKKTASVSNEVSPANGRQNEEELEEAIQNMTFSERFDLDLQFEASENITVNLIFDPVLGEVLTAQGTGQLRITMQDQDLQMFGKYTINDGNYQFVTGEIISRDLELEPGGTIVWEGAADNARLDISAIYNARPNISNLTSTGDNLNQQDQTSTQVPVELIVEINGTLNSVENNYYFRLPSSLDISSSSPLQYTINQINRDEQEKLLQATSILFTGEFIPTQRTGSATASLSESLTKGSTVLNPLLSNQVISPLLSNQINALLNSDVSRLDIDFNLNADYGVDLGIALRLYNDRLILRREGQLTGGGPQSTFEDRIGDLNATYRIRRGLSLTAFHRQDNVLNSMQAGSQAGDVTPSVDGIGLEAHLNFNTWNEFFNDVNRTFDRIFGGNKEKDNKKKDETRLADQKANREEEKK